MANFTAQAIKISFMKLLNQKPLAKITVKEIVDDCKINRNSFYYHFNDIPSLLEEILLDEVNAILMKQVNPDSIYDCLLSALDFALKNKTAVQHIYNSANRELFEIYLNRVSQAAVEKYIKHYLGNLNINETDRDVIVMYYKCQLIGFALDWLIGGMKYDLRDKIKRICELFEGSMEKAIARSRNT